MNIHIHCRKISWKEAQHTCALQKKRLMVPYFLMIWEHAFSNIHGGKGINMGDVTFVGVFNKALVSDSRCADVL